LALSRCVQDHGRRIVRDPAPQHLLRRQEFRRITAREFSNSGFEAGAKKDQAIDE